MKATSRDGRRCYVRRDLVCEYCGSQFQVASYRTNARFCSRIHARKGRSGRSEKDFIASFWLKVLEVPSGCWEWQAAKTVKHGIWGGYGKGKYKDKYFLAHRMAYKLTYGEYPPEDLVVMHICDNPACVNPMHLELGTSQDNNEDKMLKGRHKAGNIFGIQLQQ